MRYRLARRSRQTLGFGRSAGGCAEQGQGAKPVQAVGAPIPGFAHPPGGSGISQFNQGCSDHLVLPERALHRPPQLLGSRGPLRHGPDANAVVGGGDAGQPLTETPHLMGAGGTRTRSTAAVRHTPPAVWPAFGGACCWGCRRRSPTAAPGSSAQGYAERAIGIIHRRREALHQLIEHLPAGAAAGVAQLNRFGHEGRPGPQPQRTYSGE